MACKKGHLYRRRRPAGVDGYQSAQKVDIPAEKLTLGTRDLSLRSTSDTRKFPSVAGIAGIRKKKIIKIPLLVKTLL